MKRILAMICLVYADNPAEAELIASWNFNSSITVPSGGIEIGTASLDTSDAVADLNGSGTSQNRIGSDNNGTPLRISANSTEGENGQSIVFSLTMSGYQDLVLTYATTRTGTGFTDQIWSYSTDNSTFTEFTTVNGNSSIPVDSSPASASYAVNAVNFSPVSVLNDDSTIWIRLTLNGATGTAGGDRFDNIQFNATSIPEPAEWGLISALGLLAIGVIRSRQFRRASRISV